MNYFDIMKEKKEDYKKDFEQKHSEACADRKKEKREVARNTVM